MAITRISDDVRSGMADVLTAALDSGTGAAKIRVYAGTLNDLDPTGDTLLAEFTLTDPAAGAALAGVATLDFDPDLSTAVLATGIAGYWLGVNSDNVAKVGGDVGTSGASMNFASTSWTSGGTVNLTTGTVTMPATT